MTKRIPGHRGHKLTYQSKWDAYWCETCMAWAEGKCSAPECEFCSKRPDYIKKEIR